MTRKHYIAIAALIKTQIDSADEVDGEFEAGQRHAARRIAVNFAKLATADNPNFDANRFLTACGISDHQNLVD